VVFLVAQVGLQGIPTNCTSALVEPPRLKQQVGWDRMEARPCLLSAREGARREDFVVARREGGDEVRRSRKRTWDER
jgi:hypothetical protein